MVYVCIYEDLFSCLYCCFFNSLCLLAGSSVLFLQIASYFNFFFFWVALQMVSVLEHCWGFVIQRYIGVPKCMVWNDQTSNWVNKHCVVNSCTWLHILKACNYVFWCKFVLNVLFPHFIVAFTFYSALFMHLSIWIKQVCESSQCMQTEKACSKVRDP